MEIFIGYRLRGNQATEQRTRSFAKRCLGSPAVQDTGKILGSVGKSPACKSEQGKAWFDGLALVRWAVGVRTGMFSCKRSTSSALSTGLLVPYLLQGPMVAPAANSVPTVLKAAPRLHLPFTYLHINTHTRTCLHSGMYICGQA